MFIREVNDKEYLCIYKYDKDDKMLKYNIKNKVIDNKLVLIVGNTGSGKSVTRVMLRKELKDHGYLCLQITEKKGDEFVDAVCTLPPEKEYHLAFLNKIGVMPFVLPEEPLAKIHHPFTFSIPFKKKLPSIINFYTSSVKRLSDETISSIMTSDADKETVRITLDALKSLGSNDNMWNLLMSLRKRIIEGHKHRYSRDPNDLFIPIKGIGSSKTLSVIRDSFKPFRDHFFLAPDNEASNFDFKKLNDEKQYYHIISTKYIRDKRVKYVVIIDFLTKLIDAIDSGVIRCPVCLEIEEILYLLSSEEDISYVKILSDVAMELLSRIRTKCYVLATTQYYSRTDDSFKALCNEVILHNLSREDEKRFRKDYGFKEPDMEVLSSLQVGECVMWSNLKDEDEDTHKIKIFLPEHAVPEQGDRFVDIFARYYPFLMKDNLMLYRQMMERREGIEEEQKRRLMEIEAREKEAEKKKSEKVKEKVTEVKKELKIVKKIATEEQKMALGKEAYTMKKEDPKISWRKLGKAVGKDEKTVKAYCLMYAKSIGDDSLGG